MSFFKKHYIVGLLILIFVVVPIIVAVIERDA